VTLLATDVTKRTLNTRLSSLGHPMTPYGHAELRSVLEVGGPPGGYCPPQTSSNAR